jgi:6-phosphogluconolactonase
MNFDKISRIAKVSIGSAAMVLGLASCSLDYVVGYVYMTTNKSTPGVIDQYAIDFQSGALASIGTPVAAGNNPVRLVASPSGKFIYVVNQGSNTVQEFAVQGDGTLASKNTYATGNMPTAVAIDPQGQFLYVTFNYQTGASGPGGISIFPVNADNSLGTARTQPVGNLPVGIVVSYFNHFVYVVDQETPTTAMILGFSQNTSTGALTPVCGSNPVSCTTITTVAGQTVATGYPTAGVPSAIAEEPTSRFLYVTDQTDNYLIGYNVAPNGSLTAMLNSPFPTGKFPISVTIDPTGKLLYVVNFNDNTVGAYAIDSSTGTPAPTTGAQVGVGPTCATIDPALGAFLYTSNNLDNTVTGEHLNQNTGALSGVENSPFNASGQPTCLVSVANGAHATQVIQP